MTIASTRMQLTNASHQEQLAQFEQALRIQNPRALRDECARLFVAGIEYHDIAKIIWRWISEKSVADPSWLPAASCVNFADSFSMVSLQHSRDMHRQILFGEPVPDFARSESPPPLNGTLDDLRLRLPEVAASNDWLLTERCLIGIARQSDAKMMLTCLIAQLLRPEYLGARSNAWWTELRAVTARCMTEIWQRYGDEAILPVACRVGARLCARRLENSSQPKQEAMALLQTEYSKLDERKGVDHSSFDEESFRQRMSSGDIGTMFAAITKAWINGASLAQIELALTMLCIERILKAASGEGANWPNLRNDLMATANIGKLKTLGESYSIRSAYHAAWLLFATGTEGFANEIPAPPTEPISDEEQHIRTVIKAVKEGGLAAAIELAHRYAADGRDGLEFLRRVYIGIGHDFTYAGQRCIIEAWQISENHPERNRILVAAVGWEAHWRRQHQSNDS